MKCKQGTKNQLPKSKKKVCVDQQQKTDTQKDFENFFNITVERTPQVYAEVYARYQKCTQGTMCTLLRSHEVYTRHQKPLVSLKWQYVKIWWLVANIFGD